MALNRCEFIGNLGQDPEIRTFGNGDKVANLRLAVTEKWKDRDSGERREATEWISIAAFGPLAGIAEQYLRKGSKIFVAGKWKTRKWTDQSGADRYSTECVLQGYDAKLEMLDAPGSNDDRERQQAERRSQQSARQASYDAQRPSGAPAGGAFDDGDSIPFHAEWRL